MKEQKYREQYCEKHNQHYADFLSRCPICRGEEMNNSLKGNDLNGKESSLQNC